MSLALSSLVDCFFFAKGNTLKLWNSTSLVFFTEATLERKEITTQPFSPPELFRLRLRLRPLGATGAEHKLPPVFMVDLQSWICCKSHRLDSPPVRIMNVERKSAADTPRAEEAKKSAAAGPRTNDRNTHPLSPTTAATRMKQSPPGMTGNPSLRKQVGKHTSRVVRRKQRHGRQSYRGPKASPCQ